MKLSGPVSLLLAGGLGLAASAQDSGAPPVTATSRVVPESARIGEPLTLELDLVHPGAARPRIGELLLEEEGGWLRLGDRRILTRPEPDRPGTSRTRATWRFAALEPGEHELRPAAVELEWEETLRGVEVPPARVTVRGALADGEDAPRPTIGFREPPGEPRSRTSLLLALLLVPAAAAAWLVWRIARPRPRDLGEAPPGPRERLEALSAADPDAHREVYYELSRAVREAIDLRAGEDFSACTDEEWIERRTAGSSVLAESIERTAELLRACERIKYASETPTRWAVEDALGEARAIAADLEEVQR